MVQEDFGMFKHIGNNCGGHKHCFLDAMKWYQGDMRGNHGNHIGS